MNKKSLYKRSKTNIFSLKHPSKIQKGLHRKKYDYIYTILNTNTLLQVVNFSLMIYNLQTIFSYHDDYKSKNY